MKRASVSLSSILGVVPEETSEWNPEIAPQAMVTNRKGNSLPLMIGPPPLTNGVNMGNLMSGMNDEDADDQDRNRSELDVGGKIVARLQQQPHRQDRRDEAIERHQIA